MNSITHMICLSLRLTFFECSVCLHLTLLNFIGSDLLWKRGVIFRVCELLIVVNELKANARSLYMWLSECHKESICESVLENGGKYHENGRLLL